VIDSCPSTAPAINAQTSYAIFVPLLDNLVPSVIYTGACMIRIEPHIGIEKLNVLTGLLVNALLKKIK
jgi:hypothetical protein